MRLHDWLDLRRGRTSALADYLGVSAAAVSVWRHTGVPRKHLKAIVYATHGAVTLEEMVPDAPPRTRKVSPQSLLALEAA